MDSASGPFKVCGSCRRAWPTWDGFVQDPDVRLLGLQSLATHPGSNLIVFEHSCGSSISVLARRLRHLLPEPDSGAPLPVLFGTAECRGHCRSLQDLEACDAPCANVRDRALVLLIHCLKKAAPDCVRA
ncbi:MAG TPA: hypothetical protein VMS37_01840 [Verrucomicrobiae bacterium]|nr:hypothetical protein [Verrucomicrobiae bacterium]